MRRPLGTVNARQAVIDAALDQPRPTRELRDALNAYLTLVRHPCCEVGSASPELAKVVAPPFNRNPPKETTP